MASRKIILEPGFWYAGLHLPWYVPQGMIASALAQRGLTGIAFHPRSERLPPAVNPRNDPHYSDGWQLWMSARFDGPTRSEEIEEYQYVDWLLHVPPSSPTLQDRAPTPAPKASPAPTDLLGNILDPETLGRHLIAGFVAAKMTHNLIVKVLLTIVFDEVLVVAEAKAKARVIGPQVP